MYNSKDTLRNENKKLFETFYGNEHYALHCKLHPDEWHLQDHKNAFKNTTSLKEIFTINNYNVTTYKATENCIFYLENSKTMKYKQKPRIMKMHCLRHNNEWMYRSFEDNIYQLYGIFRCNFEDTEKIIYEKSIDLINSPYKSDLYIEENEESLMRLNSAIQEKKKKKDDAFESLLRPEIEIIKNRYPSIMEIMLFNLKKFVNKSSEDLKPLP